MTTSELMQLLAAHPPDLRVVVDGYEEGHDDLEQDLISMNEIRLDVGSEWWEGWHRDSWDVRAEGSGIVKALLLRRPWKNEGSHDFGPRAASRHSSTLLYKYLDWLDRRGVMATWQLQDAKNRFSAVVDAALAGEPQRVTRRGRPAVVVVAVEEYERLCQAEKADTPPFMEQTDAHDFIQHLLAIPKASDDSDTFELPSRTRDYRLREIDF